MIARKLTRFSEKPRISIAQNAGKIDSGSEIAAMMVALISRKNRNTIDDSQDRAFEQGRDRRFVIAFGEFDRGVDQLEVDFGVGDLQGVDALLHGGGDHHVARAL